MGTGFSIVHVSKTCCMGIVSKLHRSKPGRTMETIQLEQTDGQEQIEGNTSNHLLVANDAKLMLYGCKSMPQAAVVFFKPLPAQLATAALSRQCQLRLLLKQG